MRGPADWRPFMGVMPVSAPSRSPSQRAADVAFDGSDAVWQAPARVPFKPRLVATQWLARSHRYSVIVAGLLAAGLALRLVWAIAGHHLAPIVAEMYEIAQGYARTGVVSDAYHFGSGPTAHAAPAWPVFVGSIYRIFGLHSSLSEYVLTAVALLLVGTSIVLFDRIMARLGTPAWARLAAVAFVALVPLNFELEVELLRTWEQAVAAAAMAAFLLLVLRLDARPQRLRLLEIAGLAALIAPVTMLSPAAALGAYGCLGLLALRRRSVLAVGAAAALAVLWVVLLSYPWALRNEQALGERVWSRSNFGFVFAEGFHAAAVDPADPRQVFIDRMAEIDPFERHKGFAAMTAAGGEPGYNRYWTSRTWAWAGAHPADAARIALRHVREFFLPPQWLWTAYTNAARFVAAKQALVWGTAIFGFLGVGWGLWRRDYRYLYVLAMLVLPAAPYILAQPIIRYRYLIATLLVFLAADFAGRAVQLYRRRRALAPA